MNSQAIEKIKSLISKSEDKGSTESEAFQAIAMAKKLMDKYGVTLEDIREDRIQRSDYGFSYEKRGKISTFEKLVAGAIAAYTNTIVDIYHVKTIGVKRNDVFLRWFGHKIDVQLAEFMMQRCNSALKTEWNSYRTGKQLHGNSIKDFSVGMAVRICDRITALMEQEVSEKGTDLVVLKNALVIQMHKDATHDDKVKSSAMIKYKEDDSFEAGFEAGGRADIHHNVNGGPYKILMIEKD